MAGTNLDFYCGETLTMSFSCKDGAGAAFPLTGYSARGQIRSSVTSSTVILDLSPTIPTPNNGVISVSKTDEQTLAVAPGTYYWDVVIDTPTGGVIFIAGGTAKFRKLVTRPA
jgi:hypothetical protein